VHPIAFADAGRRAAYRASRQLATTRDRQRFAALCRQFRADSRDVITDADRAGPLLPVNQRFTPSALSVAPSSVPLCGRPRSAWKRRTALWVFGPHWPSTVPAS
jgi:hypothetical protein